MRKITKPSPQLRQPAFHSRGAKRPVLGEVSVNNIAVLDAHRRKGIAKALLQQMLLDLSQAQSVTLEVRKSNSPAIALYKAFGFEQVGERKNFYSQPTENAILMTKILNGET